MSGLPGPVLVVYEAGPTGFGLARLLAAAGIECLVAAPSKLQRPSGDRVKTDARDAEHLAQLALLGQISPVRVPGRADVAARDLLRAREDVRADLMRARHRVSKLLLRHGLIYSGGQAWTDPRYTYGQPDPPVTQDIARPAASLQPNTSSCGNQPAHISMAAPPVDYDAPAKQDHAGETDTRVSGPRQASPGPITLALLTKNAYISGVLPTDLGE